MRLLSAPAQIYSRGTNYELSHTLYIRKRKVESHIFPDTFLSNICLCLALLQPVSALWARKLKKVQAKKTREIKQIKIFLIKFHFLQFQKWPNINF